MFSTSIFAQYIELNGSILQKEFTANNKISGLFTYLNNTEEKITLTIEENEEPSTVEKIIVEPKRGKQIKVIKGNYETTNSKVVSGNFEIVFWYIKGSVQQKIVTYKNLEKYPPTLRAVGISFDEFDDDKLGQYFSVKVEWKTLTKGNFTEIRKCYLLE